MLFTSRRLVDSGSFAAANLLFFVNTGYWQLSFVMIALLCYPPGQLVIFSLPSILRDLGPPDP